MKPISRLEHFLAKIAGLSDAKTLEPKTRKEYFLSKIAIKAKEAQELPTPTEEDAGKVPTVNASGAYELAEAVGGSNELFVVTFSLESEDITTADKTYIETEEAIKANKVIVAKYKLNDSDDVQISTALYYYSEDLGIHFTFLLTVGESKTVSCISYTPNGAITFANIA